MTYCSTYIGDLDDPKFSWEEGDWNGNIPRGLGESFPGYLEHYNAQFKRWVVEADVTWKQTDYGGWVAKVDKQQLLDFITYCYGTDPKGRVQELIQFVNGLDDNKIYGLVAEEY
jgi:hypothetical protein